MSDFSIKLTSFSHGAGCGCKLSPAVLREILSKNYSHYGFNNLVVGNAHSDDASVTDIGTDHYLLATTDFFMPIVDDPFLFGKIAATNAISDIYAMGGRPVTALAILGWPINTLSAEIASEVLKGGKAACAAAGIEIGGGHSIDSPEPIFGLAVNGLVQKNRLKTNAGARPGNLLFLTKPLGVGIYSTAEKKNLLSESHSVLSHGSMSALNEIGARLSAFSWVTSMTDVTGFGLAGHLSEMCVASKTSAEIWFNNLVLFPELASYIAQGAVPGGTGRNYESTRAHLSLKDDFQKNVLFDPQTSGGLLIAIEPEFENEIVRVLREENLSAHVMPIGKMTEQTGTMSLQVI